MRGWNFTSLMASPWPREGKGDDLGLLLLLVCYPNFFTIREGDEEAKAERKKVRLAGILPPGQASTTPPTDL